MFNKILAAVTVIIALILGILVISLDPSQLKGPIIVSRFFEVMIPVLAVGALLRYLAHCPHAHMMNTILSACFIFIAVLLGIFAVTLSPVHFSIVIIVSRFFEVMIPVFAVGALLKFLIGCSKSSSEHH